MTSSPDAAQVLAADRPAISASRAAILATVMTMASYAATLLQFVVYARTLGVGLDTDALAIALAWATGLAGLITTTLTGVALPRFVRDRQADPTGARSAFRSASALAIGTGVVLAVLTAAGADWLASALSTAPEARPRVADLMSAAGLLIVAWTVMGTLLALANATEHYGHAAASGVAPSTVVICALALSGNPTPEIAVQAYIAGAVAQIAWLAIVVRADLGAVIPKVDRSSIRAIAGRTVPMVLTLLLFNGAIVVARALASGGPVGDVAVFDYAARLVLAGQQVLLAGVLAVALTKWSQKAGSRDTTNAQIGRTIGIALGLVIPAATALALLSPELVDTLLTGGRFASADAARVADVLRWMAPGIAAQMVLLLGFRALIAYQALWPLAGIGVAHLAALAVVAAVAHPLLGVTGIGLAYSCSWLVGVVLTLVALRPLIEPGARIGRQAVATTIATLTAGLVAGTILQLSAAGPAIRLLIGLATFIVVGWVVGYAAGVEFVRSITRQALAVRSSSA